MNLTPGFCLSQSTSSPYLWGSMQIKLVGSIKDRNGLDLTEAEILRRGGKNTQKNYTKKIFIIQITKMV